MENKPKEADKLAAYIVIGIVGFISAAFLIHSVFDSMDEHIKEIFGAGCLLGIAWVYLKSRDSERKKEIKDAIKEYEEEKLRS